MQNIDTWYTALNYTKTYWVMSSGYLVNKVRVFLATFYAL